MTGALSHRGPDAEGYFMEGNVGLGHKRLSIIDLSDSSNQPMNSQCNKYVVVYNGEIYNYKEVARDLNLNLITTGDTEVVLEAFVKYGPEFIHKLNGMFSIAIYNKEKKELFLFRDRMGIKPLYYYYDGQAFAFASETKSLLKLPIDKSINLEAVKDYFFLEYIPGDLSVFKKIKKLENGCFLRFSKEGLAIHRYYDILDKYSPSADLGEKQTFEDLNEKLSKSIQYQSISDVPVGAFLSGGTDSSLICALFQKQNTSSINTFTIGFDVKEYDESAYAGKVAELLKTNHSLTMVDDRESKGVIPALTEKYDEPFAVPSAIPSLIVCNKARQHVKVALSGDGGDELFMGYGYYQWYNRVKKINSIGGYPFRKLVSVMMAELGTSRQKRAARVLNYPDFSRQWLHIWSQEQYMFTENEISILFSKPYSHESTLACWEKINKMPLHPFEKISLFDIKNYLPNDLLYKIDIASMASGLEVRVPFLDHHFVEFSINLPLKYKVRGKEQKVLLKKALEEFLPDDLIYRKKWGFPAPVDTWLKNDLAYLMDQYLNKEVLMKQDLFNYAFVIKLVREFKQGKSFHFKRVWSLIIFQMWYEKYIDHELCPSRF